MEDAVKNGADLPTINIEDLIGRTFISTPDENGEQDRAQIEGAEFLQDMTADEAQPLIRFKCKVGDRRFEEVLTYHCMLEWVEQDATTEKDDFYRLVAIHDHRRKQNRQWEVKVEWASGKILWNDI